MQKLDGYNEAKTYSEFKRIEVGGYIGKICDCILKENSNGGERLEFLIDITEGEYKDYFLNIWNSDRDNKDRKWKGKFVLFVPEKGETYYESNLSKFKTAMKCIEDSNSGYHWEWDEKSLKGKKVGLVFGEEEFETDEGTLMTFVKCRYFTSVENIRQGKFRIPQAKTLGRSENTENESASTTSNETVDTFIPVEDDDLPF